MQKYVSKITQITADSDCSVREQSHTKQTKRGSLGKELDSLDESMLCLSYTLVKADLRNN